VHDGCLGRGVACELSGEARVVLLVHDDDRLAVGVADRSDGVPHEFDVTVARAWFTSIDHPRVGHDRHAASRRHVAASHGVTHAHRRGVLGHGSVLTLTSHANRTSPVLRGKWVMEVLMGTPPPPPPPNVPELEESGTAVEGRRLTTREQMELHRESPTCNACHQFIDPIGLALDNYDVTGRWRIKEHGQPLDTRGELYDGTPVTSPEDLRSALLARPIPLVRGFTENLMAYAIGRRMEAADQPWIRAIADRAADENYRMTSFIRGVVESPAFRMQRVPDVNATGGD